MYEMSKNLVLVTLTTVLIVRLVHFLALIGMLVAMGLPMFQLFERMKKWDP